MKHQSAILLDVEGTTVPISFVYEKLFPYSRKHIRGYLAEHSGDPEIQDALSSLKEENTADVKCGATPFSENTEWTEYVNSAAEYCLWLMDCDRKTTALKTIQGRIWEHGFKQRELQSDIFPDVPGCFSEWHRQGRRIAIYSSGSITAQKLVFEYTPFGNLVPLIDAFFDTHTGHKQVAKSYERIAYELALKAEDVLFVSDVCAELDAASAAGMYVVLAVRPGNVPVSNNSSYRLVRSLSEL